MLIDLGKKGIVVSSELCFYISYFDILSTFSICNKQYSESISQNFVSLETIKELIEIKDMHPVIKCSVVQLLSEVYVNTENDNYFNFIYILDYILNPLMDHVS